MTPDCGYFWGIDKADADTIKVMRKRHGYEFSVVEEGLDYILQGVSAFGEYKQDADYPLEHARLSLVTRSFNSLRTALLMLEGGYYQQAMTLVRMAMEDQLVARDIENHPSTLAALLDDDGKLGKGELTFAKMARRVSDRTGEVWDYDYGALSQYGAHPRAGSMWGLGDIGTDGRILLRPGGKYDEVWVNFVLYYMLRELLQVFATIVKVMRAANIAWAIPMSTLEKVDSLWRQIDDHAREELGVAVSDSDGESNAG